jgi:hypothetical protein
MKCFQTYKRIPLIPLDFKNSCGRRLQLLAGVLNMHRKKSGRKIFKLRKYFTPMFALAKMMFHIVVRCGNYARFAEIKLSTCVQLNPRLGLHNSIFLFLTSNLLQLLFPPLITEFCI